MMSADDDQPGDGSNESASFSQTYSSLDYLWDVAPDNNPENDDANVAPPQETDKQDLSSTSIFRFTLEQYQEWLKSLEPE